MNNFVWMEEKYVIKEDFRDLTSLIDKEKEYLFLIDRNVDMLYGDFFQGPKIIIDAEEEIKSFGTANEIVERMLEMEFTRDALLVGVGGGITTDIAGFVASIYKRGIRVAFIPTTLIAQADAAVGGKNGVNSARYKNMIGCFKEPEWVYVNTESLNSLSRTHYLSGIAEVLKSFIIGDRELYFKTVDHLNNGNIHITGEILREAVAVKCSIVKDDLMEEGRRRLLNLGHTFGHAIELTERVPHGIAVAQGIIISARISNYLGLLDNEETERIERDFKEIGLIGEGPVKYCSEDLFEAVIRDKKRSEDFIRFVAIERIGSVRVVDINIKELRDVAGYLY